LLELYSDYRDGLITDPRTLRSVQQHLRHCGRCMNYDALVSRGVIALKATSDIRPSTLFSQRLEQRLVTDSSAVRSGEEVRPAHAGIMVGLMVATAVAMLLWVGVVDEETSPAEPVSARVEPAPAPEVLPVVRQRPVDLERPVDLVDWSVPAYSEDRDEASDQQVSFETWVSLPR
jgi:hypothetical protein